MENILKLKIKPKDRVVKLVSDEEINKLKREYSNINKGHK